MSRKTTMVTLTEGRDRGKTFLITEMPAAKGDRWAMRALLALAHADIEVPAEVAAAGWVGIGYISLKALSNAKYEEVQPLFDELLACVEYVPDPNKQFARPPNEDDIEEIATYLQLRWEVFNLHAGFFVEGVLLRFRQMIVDFLSTLPNSSNILTSLPDSAPSSQAGSPPFTN